MAIVNQQLITTQLDMLTVPANTSYAITNILEQEGISIE